MKFIFPLFLSVFALSAQAKCKVEGDCGLSWNTDASAQVIELIEVKKGCAFPGDEREDCFLLKFCDGNSIETGSSVFRKSVKSSSYCLEGKEQEAFSPSSHKSPRAFIECKGLKNPVGIRLESPDGKIKKICKFPYQDLSL